MPRIRMCDADREKYGGPEWVEISMAEILDEETGLIELLEDPRGWDLSVGEFLTGVGRGMTRPTQAMIWLARRKAGCKEDPLTFRPKVQKFSDVQYEPLPAERKAVADDADADPPVNRAARRAVKKTTKRAVSAT